MKETADRNMDDVRERKAQMRRQMLWRRDRLERDYCFWADKAILHRLLGMEVYRQAEVIFTYVSVSGEVDTKELIRCALGDGKRVAVPRCRGKGIMRAYCIGGPEELEAGAYGILEPGRQCPRIEPEEIGLTVVPCVCCSPSGVRLGYGGGYYDRYLPKTTAPKAALCRERMMAGDILGEEHDCLMDFVVTEERVLETAG